MHVGGGTHAKDLPWELGVVPIQSESEFDKNMNHEHWWVGLTRFKSFV